MRFVDLLKVKETLNDYNIEYFGDFSDFSSKVRHIRELDLTDNLLSDWSEVADILVSFKSLTFLNLSNNLLTESLDNANNQVQDKLANANLAMEKVMISSKKLKSKNLNHSSCSMATMLTGIQWWIW